ncbi:MAG TPA: hypothetical protein VF109_00140, partial [Mycobacteriales bacterium]
MTGPDPGVLRTPDGVLYRPGQLLAAAAVAPEAARALGALGAQVVGSAERYGIVRLELAPGVDPVVAARQLPRSGNRALVAPNHLLGAQTRGEPELGVAPPPWAAGLGEPAPDGPVVTILDGIAGHRALDARVGAVARTGAVVGTFAAGLVSRDAPRARLRGTETLGAGGLVGLVDEWALLDAAATVRADLPSVVLVPFAGRTLGDESTAALERVIADLSDGAVVVAAAGETVSGRPSWPAASQLVVAVGEPEGTGPGGRPPWVDAEADGSGLVSTWPGPYGRDTWARWGGSAFAAAVVAGGIAGLLDDRFADPRRAAREFLRGGTPRGGAGGYPPLGPPTGETPAQSPGRATPAPRPGRGSPSPGGGAPPRGRGKPPPGGGKPSPGRGTPLPGGTRPPPGGATPSPPGGGKPSP